MKKFIAMLLLLATVVPVTQAQIVRSRTFGDKKKNPVTWYAKVGVSMDNLAGPARGEANKEFKEYIDEAKEDGYSAKVGFKTKAGFDILAGFRKNFGKTNVYWGMELGFGTRGGKYYASEKYSDDDYDEAGATASTYTVKYTPFQVGYIHPFSDKLKLDVHLSVFASYDLKSTSKGWEYDRSEVEDDTESADFIPFDAGMKLGLGIWYDRFNLDFSWQRGFIDYLRGFPWGETYDGKYFQSSNFMISLGVAF